MDPDHQISNYDRSYGELHNSQFLHTKPHTVKSVDWLGRSETFILETVRAGDGDVVFVECVNSEGHTRLRLPGKVVAALYRNKETLTNRSRKAKSKQAMDIRIAEMKKQGITPTFFVKKEAQGE